MVLAIIMKRTGKFKVMNITPDDWNSMKTILRWKNHDRRIYERIKKVAYELIHKAKVKVEKPKSKSNVKMLKKQNKSLLGRIFG